MAEVPSLKGNVFKKLLVIGKTGTGKSTLCNRFAGLEANSCLFPVSSKAASCTQSTKFGNVMFGGNKERAVSLIDTIGFDDPDNDTDIIIISELVEKLKFKCDYVNLFAIAVNGQSPRLDGSLVAMIKIFEEMFGPEFWNQCVLIFTRVPMDAKQKKMRQKNTGKKDDEIARDYLKVVETRFPKGGGLSHLFLDACFDKDDEDEEKAFKDAMETLYTKVENAPKLETSKVNESVESEHGKVKRELEAREKDKKEFTQQINEMGEKMKNAEMNRAKDEANYQKQVAQMEKQMENMAKAAEKKRGKGFFNNMVDALNPFHIIKQVVIRTNELME